MSGGALFSSRHPYVHIFYIFIYTKYALRFPFALAAVFSCFYYVETDTLTGTTTLEQV